MKNIMVTSAPSFEGYDIVEYVDFIRHQSVFSSNFVQELAANIADSVGGEGRALEDKLEEAADNVMKEFKEIAEEKGANAVINISMDYTNLSGNVASVMVTGTAVKIVKKKGTLKENVKVLSVSNYLNKKIIRPFEVALHVDGQQVYMSVKVHNYEMTKISAMKLDVTFMDIYGEKLSFPNVDYAINQDINILIQSDRIPIEMDARKVGLQTDVKVAVRKYVKDHKVYEVAEQPVDSSLTSEQLTIFKQNKGADAVDKYRKTDTYWRCICGAINLPGDTQCSMCNREEKDFLNNYRFDYEAMLATMEDAKSAEEIKDILMQFIPEIDSGSRVELLEILQSAINMEKTRGKGSMKISVLDKLKRKFELS